MNAVTRQGTRDVRRDVTSDPARNDEPGHDWATEGGALPEGPATDEDAADGAGDEQDGGA